MKGSGCSSSVGRTGSAQSVSLGNGCVYTGMVTQLLYRTRSAKSVSLGDGCVYTGILTLLPELDLISLFP